METIIVTTEEIKAWVKTQPDDRKVDMHQTRKWHSCGCLMVQYGREVLPDFNHVGGIGWYAILPSTATVALLETPIDDILGKGWSRLKTFGEIKERLKL